jgi:hypothetical protein
MQAAKDTFLMTLAARLAVVNPARTLTLDGVTRPAVLALENEIPMPTDTELETFLLSWQGVAKVAPGQPLMQMECTVSYGSKGTDDLLRTDRGRILTAMDRELLRICEPPSAAKCDYTQTPPAPLGTYIFWSAPVLEAAVGDGNGVLKRTAVIKLFFFPEVA